MTSYSFKIIASGLDPDAEDFEDRFFEAGCDDATVAVQKGLIVLDFDREARNFIHAVVSAVRDIEAAGARVERIEPDHLVSQSEIATRAGVGRAAVSLYARGERGRGFPRPVARVTTETPLWDWVEIAAWLHQQGRLSLRETVQARVVRAVNRAVSDEDASETSRLGRQLRRAPREEREYA